MSIEVRLNKAQAEWQAKQQQAQLALQARETENTRRRGFQQLDTNRKVLDEVVLTDQEGPITGLDLLRAVHTQFERHDDGSSEVARPIIDQAVGESVPAIGQAMRQFEAAGFLTYYPPDTSSDPGCYHLHEGGKVVEEWAKERGLA